ncbi:MAG TPA: hypothetical protein DEO65_03120 [Bacillus bacterium]|nr:hypothetical protein [Bacillus sp. (in: firmicutes)]
MSFYQRALKTTHVSLLFRMIALSKLEEQGGFLIKHMLAKITLSFLIFKYDLLIKGRILF